jgi:putative phosphoesterase
MSKIVGVISDTHGLLRPEAKAALAGCDAIVHAGDIGKPEVLSELEAIAPVTAIRGNVDKWAGALPDTTVVEIGGRSLYVIHDLKELDLDPRAAGFDAVISGHSHKPSVQEREGVLYLNPGSAGPRRFKLPIAVARLEISAARLTAQVVELDIGS